METPKNFLGKIYDETKKYVKAAVLAALVTLAVPDDALSQTNTRAVLPAETPKTGLVETPKSQNLKQKGTQPMAPRPPVDQPVMDDYDDPVVEDPSWDKEPHQRTPEELEQDLLRKAIEEYRKAAGSEPNEELRKQMLEMIRFKIQSGETSGPPIS